MNDKILLQFDAAHSYNHDGKHVRDGLSTVLKTGKNLWLACDERVSIERLTQLEDGSFGKHKSFNLGEYLELAGKEEEEIDIEGMCTDGKYLWLTGSHSLKRKKPRKHDAVEEQMRRLAKVKAEANRFLLARIPIVYDEKAGDYLLYKECPDPEDNTKTLRAERLKGGSKSNQLTDVLQQDEHLKDYFKIPSKDNGFDIEGLSSNGNRIFIGLRGPVLVGWSVVIEIEVEEDGKGYFALKEIAPQRPYKKHFLHLKGKGIRELRVNKEDIYILAGPTMDLDGVIAIYRWNNALQRESDSMVWGNEIDRLTEVPHGTGKTSGKDKAEGLSFLDDRTLLIAFDSPTDERKVGADGVLADLVRIS